MAVDDIAAGPMVDVWVTVPQVTLEAADRIAVKGADQRPVFAIIYKPPFSRFGGFCMNTTGGLSCLFLPLRSVAAGRVCGTPSGHWLRSGLCRALPYLPLVPPPRILYVLSLFPFFPSFPDSLSLSNDCRLLGNCSVVLSCAHLWTHVHMKSISLVHPVGREKAGLGDAFCCISLLCLLFP